jgi:hypothetical protein
MKITSLVAAAVLIAASLTAQRISPCQFTRIDPTCGPIYTGVDRVLASRNSSAHMFTLNVTKAPANAPGVLAFSMKQVKIAFPGTKCLLLVDPTALLLLPFNANAQGAAQLRFTVMGTLKGTVFSQAAHDRSGSPVMSNGQKITCR